MVRKEDEQFNGIIDHLIEYTKTIKVSLFLLIQRIETEDVNMNWPAVLDSFTSVCGQMNTLMRFARENKSQFIENRVVLPLMLSPVTDPELAKLTEGRVQLVNAEMVPDYLRTKPDPEIEELERALQTKSNTISPEAAVKQINAMTKLVDNIINAIKNNSDRATIEMGKQALKPSFNVNDTNELILATSSGKGLRTGVTMHRGIQMSQSSDSLLGQKPHDQMGSQQKNVKAPELKTNIRAGP